MSNKVQEIIFQLRDIISSSMEGSPAGSDTEGKDFSLLTDYRVSLEGIFLSLPNASISYENIFNAWENAFFDYLTLPPEAFLAILSKAVETNKAPIESSPNFFNIAWEELFNVPVSKGGTDEAFMVQNDSEGRVTSSALEMAVVVNSGIHLLPNLSVILVQSVPVTFSSEPLPAAEQPPTLLPPVVPVTEESNTPDVLTANDVQAGSVLESALAGGSNPGTTSLTITGSLIGVNGNSFGAAEGWVSNVTTAMPGWNSSMDGDGIITVSDGAGNQMVVNPDGDYTFTLGHAVENVNDDPFEMIFHYTFADANDDMVSADLSVMVNDDMPVASNTDIFFTDPINTGNFLTLMNYAPGADELETIDVTGTVPDGWFYRVVMNDENGVQISNQSGITGNFNYTYTGEPGTVRDIFFQGSLDQVTPKFTIQMRLSDGFYLQSTPSNEDWEAPFSLTFTDGDGSSTTASLDFSYDDGIPPVVLDLDGNGINLISPKDSNVTLNDIMGNGDERPIGWIGEGDGILMFDADGDGKLSNLNEISFISYLPGAKTDLEGLTAFDTNGDKVLDNQDEQYNQFGVLDANGTFWTFSQAGIASISLISDNNEEIVNDNMVYGYAEYTKENGDVFAVADVEFKIGVQDVLSEQPIDFSQLPEIVPPNTTLAPVTVAEQGEAQPMLLPAAAEVVQPVTEQLV